MHDNSIVIRRENKNIMYYCNITKLNNGYYRLRVYKDTINKDGFVMSYMDTLHEVNKEIEYWIK